MQTILAITAAGFIIAAVAAIASLVSQLREMQNANSEIKRLITDFTLHLEKVADKLQDKSIPERLGKIGTAIDGINKQVATPFDNQPAILPFPDSKHLRIFNPEL